MSSTTPAIRFDDTTRAEPELYIYHDGTDTIQAFYLFVDYLSGTLSSSTTSPLKLRIYTKLMSSYTASDTLTYIPDSEITYSMTGDWNSGSTWGNGYDYIPDVFSGSGSSHPDPVSSPQSYSSIPSSYLVEATFDSDSTLASSYSDYIMLVISDTSNNVLGIANTYYTPSSLFSLTSPFQVKLGSGSWTDGNGTTISSDPASNNSLTTQLGNSFSGVGINCLLKGTKISTPNGNINIEFLKKGDIIYNSKKEEKEIKYVCYQKVDVDLEDENRDLFKDKYSLKGDKELIVSGGHMVKLGNDYHLPIYSEKFENIQKENSSNEYFHLELEEYDYFIANGIEVESLSWERDQEKKENYYKERGLDFQDLIKSK